MAATSKKPLGIKAAAKFLNLSENHLRRLADRGVLGTIERDSENRRQFRIESLRAFADSRAK